jgi:hypothetical protein
LDYNPFTAIEVPSASASGCGTNSAFDVQNASGLWCADFVKWVWAEAGVTSHLSTLTVSASSFYDWGKQHSEPMSINASSPQAGDAVVFLPSWHA